MIQQSGPKDKLVENTGYIASLTMTVAPEIMNKTKNAIEDTWITIYCQVLLNCSVID